MSIIPVRELGRVGVVTDIPGYNVPINAVTRGTNVRFDEGSISRAPIFRKVKDSLGLHPRSPSASRQRQATTKSSW